ncbi:GD13527 [Drosophila simulans]|uniref:GD13527 n=1 Tax=Drosophila simulans TaxID=7240 RepID=B4QLC8_DROSI|nr:GD13527 [Drosophila simulans]
MGERDREVNAAGGRRIASAAAAARCKNSIRTRSTRAGYTAGDRKWEMGDRRAETTQFAQICGGMERKMAGGE